MPVKARTVVELVESQCAEGNQAPELEGVDGERLSGVHRAVLIGSPECVRVRVPKV